MRNALSLFLVLAALPAASAAARADDPQLHRVTQSAAYAVAHPGEQARQLGFKALKQDRPAEARRQFLFGARYADKLSQFMLGQLYWEGIGGPVDRPLAYAWMDLAAERGNAAALARREVLWNALDADEQARAVAVGKPLQARYADATAQPRLEAVMRRNRKDVTGSMLGWAGKVSVCVAEEHKGMARGIEGTCPPTVGGETYYDDRLWEPQQYWASQDAAMTRQLGTQVEVGPLKPVTPSAPEN
ncbi:MAG TPA: hypothetical protein VIP30_03725 [Stenotrophomonas sp.]